MNKLTEIRDDVVVAFRRRRLRTRALVCAWRLSPATGKLFCVWSEATARRELTVASPLRRARLKHAE